MKIGQSANVQKVGSTMHIRRSKTKVGEGVCVFLKMYCSVYIYTFLLSISFHIVLRQYISI